MYASFFYQNIVILFTKFLLLIMNTTNILIFMLSEKYDNIVPVHTEDKPPIFLLAVSKSKLQKRNILIGKS